MINLIFGLLAFCYASPTLSQKIESECSATKLNLVASYNRLSKDKFSGPDEALTFYEKKKCIYKVLSKWEGISYETKLSTLASNENLKLADAYKAILERYSNWPEGDEKSVEFLSLSTIKKILSEVLRDSRTSPLTLREYALVKTAVERNRSDFPAGDPIPAGSPGQVEAGR